MADTAAEAFDGIDRLPVLFDTLRVESAALAALHRGDRSWQRGTTTVGGVDVASLLAQLKTAVEVQTRDTTPLSARILAAVGDGPTSWDHVVGQLGVDKLDTDACAVRGFLVEDGLLAWVDHDGRPTAAAGQATPVSGGSWSGLRRPRRRPSGRVGSGGRPDATDPQGPQAEGRPAEGRAASSPRRSGARTSG
jgi:hypothetical protein